MGARSSYSPGTFCWVDLATSEPQEAITFYTGLLGWEADDGAGASTSFRVGGRLVSALHGPAGSHASAWHSWVSVADADAIVERAGELGGAVVQPVHEVGGSGRMAVLADPTGATFAVWQPGTHYGAELVNDPGALCLNQLNTDDPDGAGRFYTDLFAWRIEPAGTEANEYWGIFSGETLNGGMMPLPSASPAPAHWLVYFTVPDVEVAARRISELGGAVVVPPMAVPPSGRILVATDPQGAVFALFEGRVDP